MEASRLPLSRPFLVASLSAEGTRLTVEADANERSVLAEANDLVALNSLVGRYELRPQRGGQGVRVIGVVTAAVVQTCTVSLEPGVEFDAGAFGGDKDPSPFAVLARLKKDQ